LDLVDFGTAVFSAWLIVGVLEDLVNLVT